MNNKFKRLLIFFTITTLILSGMHYKNTCDKKAKRYYQQGSALYSKEKFSDAYYNFKQIKKISNLYELSLLKQYQCANNLNDKKTSLIKLRELIKITKNDYIKPWALYQEAILSQEFDSEKQKTIKKFKYIQNNYPNSDFGIASAYKTAQLSKQTTPIEAKESYLKYLSYAPIGKFAPGALEEITKLNVIFTKKDYEIIADAKLANSQFESAIEFYQKTDFTKNWYKISKCYRNLKNFEKEKETITKGLDLPISSIDEKELSEAIYRLIALNNANKMHFLQELYSKYQNSYAIPTIAYELAESSTSIKAINLYEQIAYSHPNSIWASNSLWEVFWYNFQLKKYKTCEKIAKRHIGKYSETQDAPRVAYWYAKTLLFSKKYQQAREIFYDILNDYPLSYYSFLSAKQLKKSKADKIIIQKAIVDYDRNSLNKIIFKDKMLLELAESDDWEIIDDFKINDDYIKSWVAYKKQNYPLAMNLAKNELEKEKENILKEEKENNISFSNQILKLIYPIFYAKEINTHAQELKQSPYLFLSLIREESHFDKTAKSPVGAMGLSQLMQGTADFIENKSVSKEDLFNPSENIRIGLKYFNHLVQQFNQDKYLAILAYNAGPGNVKKWLNDSSINSEEIDVFVENIPFLETKNYIKKILSSYWTYINIYSSKNK